MSARLAVALGDIVARAVTPAERRDRAAFQPAPAADDTLAQREARWIEAATAGDRAAFERLLAARGLTPESHRQGLEDVTPAPGGEWPAWARVLEELLDADESLAPLPAFTVGEVAGEAVAAELGVDGARPWAHQHAFAPLLQVAAARLSQAVRASGVNLAAPVERHVVAQLARRWANLSGQVLLQRLGPADVLAGHPGQVGALVYDVFFDAPARPVRDGWLALFEVYPVLARLLAVTFTHWLEACRELLQRLARDAEALSATLAGGRPLGALTHWLGEAGDVHQGGRCVTILEFESGLRVVYKPKDLRVAAGFMELVQTLNDRGLAPPLHVRRLLIRDGYAWEEWIAGVPCTRPDELRRFYRRVGALARLLQLLDATDFTLQNLVAHGEQPVPIDLETLLTPRPRAANCNPLEALLLEAALDSPFTSGLITARIPGEPGRRAADVGAMAPAAARVAPFRQNLFRGGTERGFAPDYPRFDAGSAAPRLNENAVDAAAYFDDVVQGYCAAAACLRAQAARLLAPDGPLARLAQAPVRFVRRSTHIYARLIEASLRPAALRDAVEREIGLERAWRGCDAFGRDAASVQAEVDALRDLDVPLFSAHPATGELACAAVRCGRVGDEPALERVRRRLHALQGRSDEDEAALMRAALFTLGAAPMLAAGLPGARPQASRGQPRQRPWLEHALALGHAWLAAAQRGEQGEIAWTALDYHAWSDTWRFKPLGASLFSGRAGIAVVLAELGMLSGEPRFAAAARTLLEALLDELRVVSSPASVRRAGSEPIAPCGAYYGPGAWLYACQRGARALGLTGLAVESARAAARLPRAWVEATPLDLVTGRAGLLLALTAVLPRAPAEADPEPLRALAGACAQALARARQADGRFPPGVHPADAIALTGVPDAQSGTRLALARWAALGGAPDEPAPSTDGCASGSVLAGLAHARLWGPAPAAIALAAAERYLAASSRANFDDLLEAAEVALTAYQVAGEARHLALARELGAALADAFPRPSACDRYHLSALTGPGALAHLFLKLHAPSRVASLRLLE